MIDLINKLADNKIHLFIESGLLKISTEEKEVNPAIFEEIRSNKEALILYLSDQDTTKNGIPVTNEQKHYPLSSSQYRIWVLSQFQEGSIAYNMSGLNTIEGDFDENIFQETFKELIERHEILRASIKTNADGEVYQSIKSSSDFSPNLTYKDYRDKSTAAIQEIVKASFVAPFDFEKDDLIRISIFRTEDNKRLLIISIHHIICDGWSMGILVREFMTIYKSKIDGSSYALPKLAIQYKDYAVWQQNNLNSEEQNKQEKYWLSVFEGEIPVLDFPTDRNRPFLKTYNGKKIRRTFDEKIYKKFNSLCLQQEGTVFIGLLTVLNTLLYRYTKQTDIIVGTPVAGRDSVDLENQIGCYINTLALRNVFEESLSFQELFGQIKQSTLASFENQTYPFDSLVKKLNLKHDTSRSVLFDVMLVLQNTNKENSAVENSGNNAQGNFEIEEKVLSKFDMTFNFEEIDSSLDVAVEYNTDIFDEVSIHRVLDHFESIMNVVSQSPENPVSEIDYLSPSEKKQLMSIFDNSNVSYPSELTIIDIFEEQASKYPDSIAVVFGNETLTYKELNEASNQLGAYLREQYQTAADDLICINMRPSLRIVISILGILKSGAGYVPINADFPTERVNYIIKDTTSKVVLDENEFEKFTSVQDIYSKANTKKINTPDDIAYVIYTSGTTGYPKGVIIEHKNVTRLLLNDEDLFDFSCGDVWTMFHSYSFDFSVWEMYGALFFGGKLIVIPTEIAKNPKLFMDLLIEEKVTILNQTPSAFYNLIGQKFESSHKDLSLRYVIFGGEALTPMKLKDWKSRYPQTRLINMYGITETTVFVTYKEILDIDIELNISNIGTTIPTLSGYVLDQNQQLVPIGLIGELYVGGLGVGRGYLNKEELTKQKFIESPFVKGERLYKSGDFVRILANGEMQYEGRIDEQVKIRGYRIELSEIESVILNLPKVKEVALLVKEDASQQKSIFAYVITRSSVTVAYFRNALKNILPEYMIPSSFIELKTMPLTINGKIDKKALYSLGTNTTNTGVEYTAPTNEIEEKLVLIWEKVLEKQEIGIKDNFFHLGGDSIKSIQIASRLIQEGYSINIQDIMKYPTIDTLSKCVVKHTVSVNQDQIEQEINLSPIQSWFFENNISEYSHFNQSIILKSNAPVSEQAVRAALQMIVRHHDALRIVFKKIDEGWLQENKGDESHYFFESKTINNEEYDAYCDEFQSTINLEKGPLFKVALLRKDESDYLLFACHHLVVDGVSWRIILEDFSTLYNQYLNNIELKLPLKTNSYAEWVDDLLQFSNSSVIEKQENYWLDIKSKGDFAQKLPLDKETKISRFEDTEVCSVQLNADMTDLLITKCNTVYNTSIDDVLITALSFALNDVFNITKTTLNLEGHGREPVHNNIDITRTVGWFTTLYPTYIALKHPENNINQLIEVKETLHRIPNKGVGFGILKYVLKSIKMDSPQITYNYLGTFGNEINDQKGENNFEYSNQYKGQIVSPNMIRHSLLDVSGLIANGKLTIDIGYDKNQFFEETIEKLITSYKKHLEKLVLDLSSNQEKELTPVDLTYNKLSMEQLKKLQESLFNNN